MISTRYSSGNSQGEDGARDEARDGTRDGATEVTRDQAREVEDVLVGASLAGGSKRGARRKDSKGGPAQAPAPRTGTSRKDRPAQARGGAALVRHDFAVVFRQLVPVLLVVLAAYLVAMPVSTAAIPDASIFNLDYTHDQLKFRFWLDDLTYPVVLGAAIFGVALGIRAFRFLLVKCEATAVLSLPLSRSAVFGTRFVACLLALLVGIGVPLAVSLVVNVVALNIWTGLFEQFIYVGVGLLLTGAIACSVACIACALSGTVAEAVAFSVAMLAGVTVAAWGLNAIMDWMLVGNAAGEYLSNATSLVAPSLVDATAALNPLLFFVQQAGAHQTFIVLHPVYYPLAGNVVLLTCWAGALVVLTACALMLVRRRKGERAGIAGLNVALEFVVGIVVGLAAFGATFTLLAGLNVVAAIVASFSVFVGVSAVLLRGPLKGASSLRRTMAVLTAEAGALAAVLVVVGTGGLGFAQAVPDTDQIQSVEVSYTGSPSYLAAKFDTATAGDGAYYFSASYSFDDAAAVDIVRSVHERLIGTGAVPLAADRMDVSNTLLPYDMVVRYTLVDGSEMVRYYDRASMSDLAALTQLDDTARVRELERAVITGDLSFVSDEDAQALGSSSARQAFALGDIYLSDPLYANPMLLNCDAQARAELLAALAEDVANQSVEDRYYPAGSCRGVLMFTQAGDTAAETFAYGIENTVVYLTDEFANTLAWFEEKGLSSYLSLGVATEAGTAVPDTDAADGADGGAAASGETVDVGDLVESMTFQRYAPFEGMNAVTKPKSAYFLGYRASVEQQFVTMQDFGTKFSTSDAQEMAEVLPLCRNAYYLDGGGYLVSAKLAGQEAYAYLFIPAQEAPEWLIRVAG